MLDWMQGSERSVKNGNPIADIFKAGAATEALEGEIPEYDNHPVTVYKYLRVEDGVEEWVVRIEVPNGPNTRHSEMTYANQFTADAVFEKLKRDYDLESWEPEDEDDE